MIEAVLGGPTRAVILVIPDTDEVVITARGKLPAVGTPFEAADLLFMSDQGGDMMLAGANVMVVDLGIARAGTEQVAVPCQGADAGGVRAHGSHAGALLGVPDLDLVSVGTYGNVIAVGHPGHGRDAVAIVGSLTQLINGASVCIPKIDGLGQGDGECVVGTPVDEVEVKVLHKGRGVENLLRMVGDVAELVTANGSATKVLIVDDSIRVEVALLGFRGLVAKGQNLLLDATVATRVTICVENRHRGIQQGGGETGAVYEVCLGARGGEVIGAVLFVKVCGEKMTAEFHVHG